MGKNAAGSFENDTPQDLLQEYKVAINSVQRTVYVARLSIDKNAYSYGKKIRSYDKDNIYPNKILEIAKRSSTVSTAASTMADFIVGEGFENENLNTLVINRDGQTLLDLLRFYAEEYSIFKGFSSHVNYNAIGEIAEINELGFETVRWKADLSGFAYSYDWTQRTSYSRDVKYYHNFDPKNALSEINEEEFDNYEGQILYYIPKKSDLYTVCFFDSTVDDAQFEAEGKLYKLSNIQNGYSADYVKKVAANLYDKQKEIDELINKQRQLKGAANAGRSELVLVPPTLDNGIGNQKIFEEIPRTGIDKLFPLQNKETREAIYSNYKQPRILNGITKEGGFSKEEYLDSFDYYNSYVQVYRNQIERVINKLGEYSIWSDLIKDVKIMPKQFKQFREVDEVEKIENNEKKEEITEKTE